jgi:membrane protease YdiL (CAAX protease family)
MSALATAPSSGLKPVAPLWHTLLFLVALAGLAFSSVVFHGLLRFSSSRVPSYIVSMAAEWLMVGVVAWGARLGGSSISSLIGEKWAKPSQFFRDLGIAVGFFFLSGGVLWLVAHVIHPARNRNISNLLPDSLAEKYVWILVALTAGICEELMIRGYLQKQLHAWLKSSPAAVLVQGVLFGAAHAYQGWKNVVLIAVLGIMLGWLAQLRRNLFPGMIFHFLQDALGGLARGVF